MGYLRYW